MFVADGFAGQRHGVGVLGSADLLAAIRRLRDEGRLSNADLGRLIELPSSRIAEIFDGKRKITIDEAKLIIERYGLLDAPAPDQPIARSADAGVTVEIIRVDLSLPMGPGATVDDYIEEEPLRFDLAYVRSFSRTPPDCLRLAQGVGDSMYPTLNSNDLVWIDSTQTGLNQQDRVWAVSINGAAAIKRLRRLKGGRVLVVSDNPAIENYEVDEAELLIGGRVIRFARDL